MQLIYVLFVFIGASSYGILSTFVKLGYDSGFLVDELTGSQFFFGWLMLLILMLFNSKRKAGVGAAFKLALAGISTGLVGIFYYQSLQTIPASLAIILLFQFTWIGVVTEAIIKRKLPDKQKWLSVLILLAGTVLAGNLLESNLQDWTLEGTLFGLAAAVAYTAFMFASETVETSIHPLTRSFFMITGAMIIVFCIFPPVFLTNGALTDGLWKFALLLGFFGMVLPTILFAIGMPKIGSGLGTILGSAELPAALIMSATVLQEEIVPVQWLGMLVILFGIALPQLRYLPRHK